MAPFLVGFWCSIRQAHLSLEWILQPKRSVGRTATMLLDQRIQYVRGLLRAMQLQCSGSWDPKTELQSPIHTNHPQIKYTQTNVQSDGSAAKVRVRRRLRHRNLRELPRERDSCKLHKMRASVGIISKRPHFFSCCLTFDRESAPLHYHSHVTSFANLLISATGVNTQPLLSCMQ